MSQIAFSHQFSKRWLAAPQQVKSAIVQELDDIVQLLDDKTELSEFEFTTPDLRGYIDSIYNELAQEKEAQINAEAQANQELIEHEAAFKAAEHKMRQASKNTGHQSADAADDTAENKHADVSHIIIKPANSSAVSTLSSKQADNPNKVSSNKDSHPEEAVTDLNTAEASTTVTENNVGSLNAAAVSGQAKECDESFIKELETRIDDYLSDQLTMMSEDLKAWLREQVRNNK